MPRGHLDGYLVEDLGKARLFHIPYSYNFNGRATVPEGWVSDLQVDLTVQYPRGTLIVDDPVMMSGIAILNASQVFAYHIDRVDELVIYFQNASQPSASSE